jgi:hypothetical protein
VPTNWTNIGLVVGMVVAVITAGIALYRASAQRGLDQGTKRKIDEEVKRLQLEHDQRRTVRVLRLERYVDENVDYQRRQRQYQDEHAEYQRRQESYLNQLTALLEEAIDAGCVPRDRLPTPPKPPTTPAPEPPPLPPMPEAANGV